MILSHQNCLTRGKKRLQAIKIFPQFKLQWTQDKLKASQMALVATNPWANAGHLRDAGSISGWARSPGEGNGNPLHYFRLEYPMDRGAGRLHRVTEPDTTEVCYTTAKVCKELPKL